MLLMHRLGRLAVRAGSGLVVTAVVTGIPAGLAVFVGWPLPDNLPTTWDQVAVLLTGGVPDTAVVGLLAVALWLIWAAFCHALAVELIAAGRGHPARRIRLISPMQALAALLVAGLAASPAAASATITTPTPALAPYAATAGAAPGQTDSAVSAWPSTLHSTPNTGPAPTSVAAPAPTPPSASRDDTEIGLPRFALSAHSGPMTLTTAGTQWTVTVQRGDTLWDLAAAWLGDPHRWVEIYRLNAERYDHHGRMRGGDHIEPTWHLVLPDDARPPAGAKPHTFNPPAATAEPTTPPAQSGPTSPPATPRPQPPSATPQPSIPPATAQPTTSPGDDGMVDDVPGQASPSATGSPAASSAAATAQASPATDATPPRPERSEPPGVSLTGDSWIDLGLALAIATAATLVWRLRRRRYTPRPPTAQARLDDPDLQPMPDLVTQVRRRLRTPAPHDDASADDLPEETDEASESLDDDAEGDADPHDGAGDDEEQAVPAPPLNLPALGNPVSAAWPPAGLGLTGPGAEAAARGFLASALAAGGVDDPHGRSNVVLPAATLATLLGAAAVHVPDTPRLTVTGDLTEALELLEEQTLHRTRLVYGHEVDTVAQMREADPYEEPLPPVLLLADSTVPHERARIAALLAQGQRLDIHGVLIGQWPDGNTVVVAADGTTTPGEGENPRHGSHPADVRRLAVLTATEVAALLPTLAESHTGLPQRPAPAEPQRSTAPAITAPATVPTGTHQPAGNEPDAAQTGDCADVSKTPSVSTTPTMDAAESDSSVDADEDHGAVPAGPQQAVRDGHDADDDGTVDGPGVVAVRVLGKPVIVGADPKLRAKAMELLVYLIARDGGATTDAIIEDLVPDAPLSKAPRRIHTYVYALREALKRTGGRATYIAHPPHRYVLNRDAFDVDLWRMRGFLAEAETADGQARITALRQAVDAYHGPFADGAHYEWAEPYREAVCQQALDAHLALADALRDQPEQALAVLDAAIAQNPDAETLYQAAMRRHADLDDIDAITARLAQLTRNLEELDAEPTDETTELAAALTDELRRRARRNRGATA